MRIDMEELFIEIFATIGLTVVSFVSAYALMWL